MPVCRHSRDGNMGMTARAGIACPPRVTRRKKRRGQHVRGVEIDSDCCQWQRKGGGIRNLRAGNHSPTQVFSSTQGSAFRKKADPWILAIICKTVPPLRAILSCFFFRRLYADGSPELLQIVLVHRAQRAVVDDRRGMVQREQLRAEHLAQHASVRRSDYLFCAT